LVRLANEQSHDHRESRHELMARGDGRNHLRRFPPGEEWKKLPDCFKAPNRGRRLTPRKKAPVECLQCGKYATRHRRSARYCSIECRRRAQLERDALRSGKPLPSERVRGVERRWRARLNGIRKHGSPEAYRRFTEEQERTRAAIRDERQFQRLLRQEPLSASTAAWVTPLLNGTTSDRQRPAGVSRYVLIGR
jgi:hypothetical protein